MNPAQDLKNWDFLNGKELRHVKRILRRVTFLTQRAERNGPGSRDHDKAERSALLWTLNQILRLRETMLNEGFSEDQTWPEHNFNR